MKRYFEKISYNEFKKEFKDDKKLYEEYNLPKRSTKNSAGYDFESLIDIVLSPNEIVKIPLAVKVNMYMDEVLMIYVRSSVGFKWNVRLCNQTGIIDSDYYNNPDNEGHVYIKLQNEGNKDFIIKKGDKICQGLFIKYLTVENEEAINKTRTGGFGSTNKGDK